MDAKDVYKDFPEAPASDTVKWVDALGFEHMTSLRSWSADGLGEILTQFYAEVVKTGGVPTGGLKIGHGEWTPTPTPFDPPAEPVRVPLDDSGKELPEVKSLTVEKIDISTHDGKTYYKVMGAPFTKYGITVWPEVIEAAELELNGKALPVEEAIAVMVGWRADYVMKTNKDNKLVPDKIVRLLPPQKA